VLVYRLDRFFRNTRHLLNAFEKLKQHGIAFQSATESFNTNEISGRLLLTFLGGIAEAERETIRERTQSGKLKSAREGKWVTGVPPYGYRLDKETKKLFSVPEQAKIVKKLFRWAVDEKLPLREIERRMNNLKVPPPYNTKYKKKQTLNYWHKRTIGRILTNEVYTGEFYFRKYKRPF
jgi:site-specific DNA recombinase